MQYQIAVLISFSRSWMTVIFKCRFKISKNCRTTTTIREAWNWLCLAVSIMGIRLVTGVDGLNNRTIKFYTSVSSAIQFKSIRFDQRGSEWMAKKRSATCWTGAAVYFFIFLYFSFFFLLRCNSTYVTVDWCLFSSSFWRKNISPTDWESYYIINIFCAM